MDRDRPDDMIDANPPGGWDGVGDEETRESSEEAADADQLLTDAALQPDDPVEGEAARRGADPDLASDDADRGEEP